MKFFLVLLVVAATAYAVEDDFLDNSEYPNQDPAELQVISEEAEPAHELADDGYRYKTVRRLKYRHRRDVNELPGPNPNEYLPPGGEEGFGQFPPNFPQPPQGDGEREQPTEPQEPTETQEPTEPQEPTESETESPEAPEAPEQEQDAEPTTPQEEGGQDEEQAPPQEGQAPPQEGAPEQGPPQPPTQDADLPPNFDFPPRFGVAQNEIDQQGALGPDGYRYRTMRRIRYRRRRRDVSELKSGEYLPPVDEEPNVDLPAGESEKKHEEFDYDSANSYRPNYDQSEDLPPQQNTKEEIAAAVNFPSETGLRSADQNAENYQESAADYDAPPAFPAQTAINPQPASSGLQQKQQFTAEINIPSGQSANYQFQSQQAPLPARAASYQFQASQPAYQSGAYQSGAYQSRAYQSGAYQTGAYQTGAYQTGAYQPEQQLPAQTRAYQQQQSAYQFPAQFESRAQAPAQYTQFEASTPAPVEYTTPAAYSRYEATTPVPAAYSRYEASTPAPVEYATPAAYSRYETNAPAQAAYTAPAQYSRYEASTPAPVVEYSAPAQYSRYEASTPAPAAYSRYEATTPAYSAPAAYSRYEATTPAYSRYEASTPAPVEYTTPGQFAYSTQPAYQFAATSSTPLAKSDNSGILEEDGYHYKTIKRTKYRYRQRRQVPDGDYLPPVQENEDFDISQPTYEEPEPTANPAPEPEPAHFFGSDGYHYKTARKIKYRFRN